MPRRSALAAIIVALFLPLLTCSSATAADPGTAAGRHKVPAAAHHLSHHTKKHGHQLKRPHSKHSSSKKRMHHRGRIHKRIGTPTQ